MAYSRKTFIAQVMPLSDVDIQKKLENLPRGTERTLDNLLQTCSDLIQDTKGKFWLILIYGENHLGLPSSAIQAEITLLVLKNSNNPIGGKYPEFVTEPKI